MADTARTRAALETLLADNSTGAISAQDLRDLLASVVIQSDPQDVKVYAGLISQTGTDAPTITVLENNLSGDVVWTREGAGIYYGTLVDAFPDNKTLIITQGKTIAPTEEDNNGFTVIRANSNIIHVYSWDTGQYQDSVLLDHSIKIVVYP